MAKAPRRSSPKSKKKLSEFPDPSELAGLVSTAVGATVVAPPTATIVREDRIDFVVTAESTDIEASSLVQRTPISSVFGLSPARSVKRGRYSINELRAKETDKLGSKSMEPRLQMAVACARLGQSRVATASASAAEIPIIAKISDLAAWEELSEVRAGVSVGQTEDGNHIVTARIPVKRIEAVRGQPFVVSLKAAQPVRPTLSATLEDTHARQDLLPNTANPMGGKGVVVGIVDFGCDFAHKNFRDNNGATRIEAIWHQAHQGNSNSPRGYGRIYRRPEIDAALQNANPYAALGYGPAKDSVSEKGTHGTHVMDIAAGNGRGSGVPGCAPEATLIFVDLSADDIPWEGSATVGSSFGDSVRLLEALEFIFAEAKGRPCVINLSLGTNGGPHDGTTLVEQGIDTLLRSAPNRSVVIAASNSYADGIHASGTIPDGGSFDLQWVQTLDSEPAEMEIWLPGTSQAAIELIAPDGTSISTVEPGATRQVPDENQIVMFVANRLAEPNNKDNSIGVFIGGAFPAGTWIVRLHARGAGAISFHAWIERYDVAQSSFGEPHDNSHTLGSISCGHETIVVGSYDAHKTTKPISWFSSEGPTRDGRQKPELSAPGHDVLAAWSRTGNQTIRKSGTSMAAPAVTGIVALQFAEALRMGQQLTSTQVRTWLINNLHLLPPAGGAWHPRYGHGRVSADGL